MRDERQIRAEMERLEAEARAYRKYWHSQTARSRAALYDARAAGLRWALGDDGKGGVPSGTSSDAARQGDGEEV